MSFNKRRQSFNAFCYSNVMHNFMKNKNVSLKPEYVWNGVVRLIKEPCNVDDGGPFELILNFFLTLPYYAILICVPNS